MSTCPRTDEIPSFGELAALVMFSLALESEDGSAFFFGFDMLFPRLRIAISTVSVAESYDIVLAQILTGLNLYQY